MTDLISELINDGSSPISIALDADQVIANTYEALIERLDVENGKNYRLDDIKEYPSPGASPFGVPNEEFNRLYDETWNKDWQSIGKLADRQLLYKFCNEFKVDLVSSRGEEVAQPLRDWIKLNYLEAKMDIVITARYSNKAELPYTIFIDDAPRLSDEIRKQDDKLLMLIDEPYNRDVPRSDNVVRFKDVNSALRALLEAKAGR